MRCTFWPPQWLRAIQDSLLVLDRKQDQVLGKLDTLLQQEALEMALIDDVLAEAQRNSTIGDSVLALVQKLVDASGGDPTKLQGILDTLKADSDKLEAAVVANTPQEPPTP